MNWLRLRVIVSGRVQGVSYRWYTIREARRLDLRGWVRNLTNGDVEAFVAGPEDAVNQLLQIMRQGPPMASVLTLQTREDLMEPIPDDFEVLPTE